MILNNINYCSPKELHKGERRTEKGKWKKENQRKNTLGLIAESRCAEQKKT